MKKMTKFEIACAIENLPKNTPWSAASMATVHCDYMKRQELVDWYNRLVTMRNLELELIK